MRDENGQRESKGMSKGLIKGLIIGGGLLLAFVVFVISVGMWYMGACNGEVAKRNTFEAKKKHVETGHDTMWKVIAQKYQIKGDYEGTFKDGLKAVSEGRKGGSIFKATTESNQQLGLSTDVYNQMMATIEGQRGALKREQDTLTDMWRNHKTYCETMPRSFFLAGKVLPEPKMISSSRTKQAVETGIDDSVTLGADE